MNSLPMLIGTTALAAVLGLSVSAPGAQENPTFGYMQLTEAFTYSLQQTKGFKDAIEAHGGTVIVLDGQYSVEKQTNDVQDLILQGVAGVGILPTDGAAAVSWVDTFTENNILVVAGASAIGNPDEVLKTKGDYVYPPLVAQANSNDHESGVEIAKFVVSLLPTDRVGKIAIVEGAPGSVSNMQRTAGFLEGLEASGANYEVVSNQPTDWTPEVAEQVCGNVLTANPDLDYFFIHADTLSTGCAHAVQAAGSKAQIVSAAGGAKDGNDLIVAGEILASICTKPYTQGQAMGEALWKAVVDKDPTRGVFLTYPLVVVTKDNLDQCVPEW